MYIHICVYEHISLSLSQSLAAIPGLRLYGPPDARPQRTAGLQALFDLSSQQAKSNDTKASAGPRAALVAFNDTPLRFTRDPTV